MTYNVFGGTLNPTLATYLTCCSEWICVSRDRVVDQLRCALKAKNVIIEQLEDEKRDAVSEASRQFEMKISELNDQLRALESAAATADVS